MKAESWDEAVDIRRYWWVVPPIVFALVVAGMTWMADRVQDDVQTVSSRVTQDIEVGAQPLVVVENISGDILVTTGDDGIVRLTAVREGQGLSPGAAAANLERLELKVEREAGGVRIATEAAEGVTRVAAVTRLQVEVPRDARLILRTNAGHVTVQNESGDIEAEVVRGRIEIVIPASNAFRAEIDARAFNTNFETQQAEPGTPAFTAVFGDEPHRRFMLRAPGGEVTIRHD